MSPLFSFSVKNFTLSSWTVLWSFSLEESMFLFVVSLSFIFYLIMNYSNIYMESGKNLKMFTLVMILFYSSMQLFLFSNSLMILMLAWEGLGLTSFILVMFYFNWNSCQGASLTLFSNRCGDAFMLSIFYSTLTSNYFVMFVLIFMMSTKSAIFPFSSWLPAAMAAPTPVSALVHSSTLVTSGIALNFKYKLCYSLMPCKFWIVAAGLVTIMLGSLNSLMTVDLKKLVAFTTLSQMGFLLFSLSSVNPLLTMCYLVMHAFLKSLLFMLSGLLILSGSSQNLYFSSKFVIKFKGFSAMMIVAMNFISLFFLSLFFMKEYVLSCIFKESMSIIFWVILILILILTSFYSLRLLVIFSSGFTKVNYAIAKYSLLWLVIMILGILSMKCFLFYIKSTKNFSPTNIMLFMYLFFSLYYISCKYKLHIMLLEKLNNMLCMLLKFTIFEDFFINQNFIFLVNIFTKNSSLMKFLMVFIFLIFVM